MNDPMPVNPAAPVAPSTNFRYAGFWIRLLAQIIDGIILGVVSKILFGDAVTTIQDGTVSVSFTNWYTLIPIAYTIIFWIWLSATPGKLALGLRIVDADGKNISPAASGLRYVGYIVSAIALCIGYLWIAFDPKKQGWHDKIAKTYVIRK